MVAVMLVILDHLFGWPHGGFIGVDVFFVISGFLITGGLLHTIERDGRISFSNFYRRRVRRIVPAATLVLFVTVAVSYFAYGWEQFKSVALDATSAFFFVSNWRFSEQGTDYFAQSGPVSPIRQYWSLSVEEQFYFVWPAVMFVVAFMLGRRAQHRVRITGGLMLVLVGASFTYAMVATAASPTTAYFSTFTRAWELGVGALLAIFIGSFDRIPDRLRVYIAWLGLVTIMVGAFTITEDGVGFPAPLGLLPVLGSALVILAGVSGSQRGLTVLTNPLSRYFGDISYSLYLWHWPVIVLLATVVNGDTMPYYAASITLMFAISIWCYESFEDPIRRSRWLETRSERAENTMLSKSRWRLRRVQLPPARRSRDHTLRMSRKELVGIAAIFTVSGLVFTLMAHTVDRDEANAALRQVTAITDNPSVGSLGASDAESAGPASEKLAGEISDAIGAARWPDLDPTMDEVVGGIQVPNDIAPCGKTARPSLQECSWGASNAPKKVVIVGDSVGMTYVNPLRLLAERSSGEWMVHSEAMFGCPFADGNYFNESADIMKACPSHKDYAVDAIKRLRPDVVVVAHTTHDYAIGDRTVTPREWRDSLARQISNIERFTDQVVVIAAPPADVDISECYTRLGSPATCVSRIRSDWVNKTTEEQQMVSTLDNGKFVDSRQWFCTSEGQCPAFVGTTPVKLDELHMTPQYGAKITPAIGETLAQLGVLSVPR
ncbi:hypothetical protein SEA_MURP_33 [Gordonia phage Murp]|nr:hypothetical protein SEA_MURP_33 [Gordonia phage Murp]